MHLNPDNLSFTIRNMMHSTMVWQLLISIAMSKIDSLKLGQPSWSFTVFLTSNHRTQQMTSEFCVKALLGAAWRTFLRNFELLSIWRNCWIEPEVVRGELQGPCQQRLLMTVCSSQPWCNQPTPGLLVDTLGLVGCITSSSMMPFFPLHHSFTLPKLFLSSQLVYWAFIIVIACNYLFWYNWNRSNTMKQTKVKRKLFVQEGM